MDIKQIKKNINQYRYQWIALLTSQMIDQLSLVQFQIVKYDRINQEKITESWEITWLQFQDVFNKEPALFFSQYKIKKQLHLYNMINQNVKKMISSKKTVMKCRCEQWIQIKKEIEVVSAQQSISMQEQMFNIQKRNSLHNYKQIHSLLQSYEKNQSKIDKFQSSKINFLTDLLDNYQKQKNQVNKIKELAKNLVQQKKLKMKDTEKQTQEQQEQIKFNNIKSTFTQKCKQSVSKQKMRKIFLDINKLNLILDNNLKNMIKNQAIQKQKMSSFYQQLNNVGYKKSQQSSQFNQKNEIVLQNQIKLKLFRQASFETSGLVYNDSYMISQLTICKIKKDKSFLIDWNNHIFIAQSLKNCPILKFKYSIKIQKCTKSTLIGVCAESNTNQVSYIALDIFEKKIICLGQQKQSLLYQSLNQGYISVQINLSTLQICWKQVDACGLQINILGVQNLNELFEQKKVLYPFFEIEESGILSLDV